MIKTGKLLFFIFLSLTLCACHINNMKPRTVTINGVTYRNRFYGDLYPANFTYGSDYYKAGTAQFRRTNCDKFDLIKIATDGTPSEMIYCAESQWEQAQAYYTNENNFIYYCMIGTPNIYKDTLIKTVPNIDHNKFDALMAFAKENSYNPFSSNDKVKTLRMPFPDEEKSPRLVFYKESKDGFFTSFKGNLFHIINGKLLLVFYYDHGHGKYEELVAVDVPDELGQYFITLLGQITG